VDYLDFLGFFSPALAFGLICFCPIHPHPPFFSACIIADGAKIAKGPAEKTREETKEEISKIGDRLGIMMACPSGVDGVE
jgi:hypothetical protein